MHKSQQLRGVKKTLYKYTCGTIATPTEEIEINKIKKCLSVSLSSVTALHKNVKMIRDLQNFPQLSAARMWFSISRCFTSNLLKPFAV